MVALSELWLPILLSAIAVFAASSLIHMVLPFHKADYAKVPKEDDVMTALRAFSIPPGDYMLPRPSGMQDMKSPEFQAKWKKGPVLSMTVMPSDHNFMGATMVQWFIYCLVVSLFAAYIASRAAGRGAPNQEVSRFASTTAFAGYGLALWQNSIWYRRKWSTTLKSNVDSLIYGFLTGGMLGWLWPR
jgi:hypothetical protein